MPSLLPLIGRCLVHRWSILVWNLVIMFPLVMGIVELVIILAKGLDQHSTHEATQIIEGVGVILIGWGVALEERHSLRVIFRTIRDGETAAEHSLDELCHTYGLGLLLFGLFAEIFMECVEVPDRVINTSGIEPLLLGIATLFLACGGVAMVLHSLRLFLPAKAH